MGMWVVVDPDVHELLNQLGYTVSGRRWPTGGLRVELRKAGALTGVWSARTDYDLNNQLRTFLTEKAENYG